MLCKKKKKKKISRRQLAIFFFRVKSNKIGSLKHLYSSVGYRELQLDGLAEVGETLPMLEECWMNCNGQRWKLARRIPLCSFKRFILARFPLIHQLFYNWSIKNDNWQFLRLERVRIKSITKTRLFKYIENFTPPPPSPPPPPPLTQKKKKKKKKKKNSDKKKPWKFSYFCSKHRLWVLVRTASTRRF